MKKCTYCGQEYPDDATSCLIDTHPLVPVVKGTKGEKFSARDESAPFELPHLLKLKTRERNSGLCLVWKCPHCLDLSEFHIIKAKTGISVIGVELSELASMTNLRCAKCRYELRVKQDDEDQLAKLSELTRKLLDEEIPPDAYQRAIKETPANFVKELLALSQNWKCPTCGEENPASFESCWSCASREDPHPEVNDENARQFPKMLRGGNAWD